MMDQVANETTMYLIEGAHEVGPLDEPASPSSADSGREFSSCGAGEGHSADAAWIASMPPTDVV